jgi:hypothetical protein
MRVSISRRGFLAGSVLLLAARRSLAEKVSSATVKQVLGVARQLSPPASLPGEMAKALPGVVSKLQSDEDAAKSAWKTLVEKHRSSLDETEVLLSTRWLVRESVFEPVPDLANSADKARYFVDQKTAVQAHVSALKKLAQDGVPPHKVTELTLPKAYVKGALPSKLATVTKAYSAEQLADAIKKWEEKLNSVGDDAQLANVDLQNVLQKQQQTLQMMSNISKMLYDTAMAVIRKIGG